MAHPEIVDWDKDHVDLKWTPPEHDNGAPVEKYIVEKKDKHGKWTQALEVTGDQLTGTIGKLTEGEEYQFRIIAVNKGGASEPSDPSERVVAKPRNRNFLCDM